MNPNERKEGSIEIIAIFQIIIITIVVSYPNVFCLMENKWTSKRTCATTVLSVVFSHFHGYFDLLFAALSGYSMVFISVERWFSVWKPFDKAKYVTFKSTISTVVSYTLISIIAFSWFPLTLSYGVEKPTSSERCQLKHQTVYRIFGTISVIFTYIGKRWTPSSD